MLPGKGTAGRLFQSVAHMCTGSRNGDDTVMTDYECIYDYESLYQAHKKARLGKQDKGL